MVACAIILEGDTETLQELVNWLYAGVEFPYISVLCVKYASRADKIRIHVKGGGK